MRACDSLDVVQLFQHIKYFMRTLFHSFFVRIQNKFGILRLFVRIIYSGEIFARAATLSATVVLPEQGRPVNHAVKPV